MYDTMIKYNGIGLAAIQVNIAKQILIINIPDEDEKQTKNNLKEIINPIILESSGSMVYEEGCLSLPEFTEDVKRYSYVKIKYQDRIGNIIQYEAHDLEAVAIQHEIDHLNGHLFIEKISYLKRKKFDKEWKKRNKKRIT
jgi:peptide deformylase